MPAAGGGPPANVTLPFTGTTGRPLPLQPATAQIDKIKYKQFCNCIVNRFMIEPSDDGCNITFEMEFNGPALNGPMAKMAEKNAGVAAEQSLAKFKALLG